MATESPSPAFFPEAAPIPGPLTHRRICRWFRRDEPRGHRARLKLTAIACGVRRTIFALRCKPSASMRSTNWSGIPTGLITRSSAPVSEIFRTVQSINDLPPLKTILPVFKTRRRCDLRFSSIRDAIRLPTELQLRDHSACSLPPCRDAIRHCWHRVSRWELTPASPSSSR
jgi:hypothetical protein